ncbi:MAG: HAD family hydrolase [Candidatus Riflebacteria bacterium]|nr:HAD family hydrolase [Candidatus Riflebacteria bacterium]
MRKAIFLDRDGTLNPDPGYISNPDDFILFPGVGEALANLKKAGYLLILITNQSGISRGLISWQQLELVHQKLQNLLAAADASLDAIYLCPHHPDYPPVNGVSACDCRKPQPGMILQAIKDFDIDTQSSYVIGDRGSDVKIAINAGIQPIYIGKSLLPGYEKVQTFVDLKAAAEWLLRESANKV